MENKAKNFFLKNQTFFQKTIDKSLNCCYNNFVINTKVNCERCSGYINYKSLKI